MGTIDTVESVQTGIGATMVQATSAGLILLASSFLLTRLYEANIGRVTIDGIDITQATRASLRRQIVAVLQDSPMLSGTILDNIQMGAGASQAEAERAAQIAQIHDFIVSLPAGYATAVGANGARLSGGQRQRIALARALLRRAPILVLDEATSALDPETEGAVFAALKEEYQGRTLIFVTHRLETTWTVIRSSCSTAARWRNREGIMS